MNLANLVRIPLYCLLSLSLVLSGCCQCGWGGWFKATHERTEDLSTPISPEKILSVKTGVGSITVTGSSTSECSIHATVKSRAHTSERAIQLAEETRVVLNSTDNAVEVRINKPHLARGESVSVDLRIETPRQVHLDCAANVGEVKISNITGKVKVVTDVGKIVCINVSNQLQLQADVGEIRVKCLDNSVGSCNVNISTDVGSIIFECPSQLSAEINASTDVGSITTKVPILITGKTGRSIVSSSIEGKIGDGQGVLQLKTKVGSITIRQSQPSGLPDR